MANLFAVLLLVALVVMIVGLIKPALFKFGNKNIPSRGKICLVGAVLSIICVAMIGVLADPVEPKKAEVKKIVPVDAVKVEKITPVVEKPTEPVKEEVVEPVKIEANLGMTPEQFRTAFNAKLKELKINSVNSFPNITVQAGVVRDTFQLSFSKDISLAGTVNKDGMLRGITYIVVPKEDSQKAVMDLLVFAGVTTNVLSGSNNKKQVNDVVIGLINEALDGLEKENNTHHKIVGDVKYFSSASSMTGLWFGVEPAKED